MEKNVKYIYIYVYIYMYIYKKLNFFAVHLKHSKSTILQFLNFYSILEYSWFITLCYFHMDSKVVVIHIHVSILLQILSHIDYYRVLSIVPFDILVDYFVYNSVYMLIPTSSFIPPSLIYPHLAIPPTSFLLW